METATEHPDRILFGSCNSQHYEPVLWPSILSRNASAFVWVGDAMYADDFASQHWFPTKRVPLPATPEVLRRLYNDLLHESGYRELLEGNMTVLGTLDDHGKSAGARLSNLHCAAFTCLITMIILFLRLWLQ